MWSCVDCGYCRKAKTLSKVCNAKGLKVCPKVRVADVLDVDTDDPETRKMWFRSIAQLHVDFLVLGNNDHMLFALELDDPSHNSDENKKKDAFKDGLFAGKSIKLFRINDIPNESDLDLCINRFYAACMANRDIAIKENHGL